MDELLKIMSMLRDNEHGCPWDRKQTFETIAPHTLEEVYEVVDTIERGDYPHLPNELGDLLFQVVFYAQIGKESGLFDYDTIV
ncbi:MAG: MazG nucleotide pyrophosphohydrolase domain-containing protein, partial [Pseudomonadales bacterium]